MVLPKKHKIKQYNYVHFGSVRAFDEFVDEETLKLTDENRATWSGVNKDTLRKINSGSEWYGNPTPKNLNELNEHEVFLGMHLLKPIQAKIKQHLDKYLNYLDSEIMPKPKVAYNDRGLGMFSFDRAAMSLYKTDKINLSTPINRAISQLNVELGNRKINTAVKNVYAYFEHKNTSYPAITLYVMAGANADRKGDQLLYVGLACAELIDFLEQRGVAVELNVLLGTAHSDQISMGIIKVKRFEDRLDKNQLLLLSSDPRYFRYRGFKALIALTNYFGLTIPSSLGRISEDMGKGFVTAQQEKGFVFEQSYSLESAAKEVTTIIENYKKKATSGKRD